MLYELLFPLADRHIIFNVFQYISFRSAGAMVTALLTSFLVGPPVIRWLKTRGWGQVVRLDGPSSHFQKAGTPTMGGIIILAAVMLSILLWARLDNPYVLIATAATVWMGAIGFMDDYLKVVRHEPRGLVARYKLAWQMAAGLTLGIFLLLFPLSSQPPTETMLPFFKNLYVAFWVPAFPLFVALVVTGSANAVNLSDGLDGLATGLSGIAALTFGLFAYVIGRVDTSAYLGTFYLPGAGELGVFCAAITGAAIGFLWFNAPPADVFMGDTGSLALGGALGVTAVLLKSEFLLVLVGGVFVAEAVSVLLQTGWFKFSRWRTGTGRRLFRMAPLHHHFEKLGWPETRVVVRFYILAILCSLVGLATLKLR
ncbi:MAG: phospho-N-acetylmuramoyl-pentapeptide-transferase [Gemmatimonadetes bacterium]|nr:phospho-N-acetylmuramoyl-pentapeptide-transferase [Gemmatimonadota bacterium]